MTKKAKRKSNKIPIPILIVIYGVLLFAAYQSISTIVLAVFGQTTMGVVDYYANRIEDRTADVGRSRSIIKDYSFTVDGTTYRGRVTYLSDEAWPDLKKGETRSERICYLPICPYVNSTASLADFSNMTHGQILYSILLPMGCFGLFMLIRAFKKQAKKQDRQAAERAAKREAKKALKTTAEELGMFCESCGTKLSAGFLLANWT